MHSRYLYSLSLILALTDYIVINITFVSVYYFLNYLDKELSFDYYRQFLINVNILWLLSSNLVKLYHKSTICRIEHLYRATWKSIVLHGVFLMLYLISTKDVEVSRAFLLGFYASLCVNFVLSRFICTILESIITKKYKIRTSVAVMGMNETGFRLARYFETNPKQYCFEGFLDNENSFFVDGGGNLLPGTSEQIKKAAELGIKEVYVSLTAERIGEAGFLLQEAEKQCVRLKFVPDFSHSISAPFKINYMEEFPVISLRVEPLDDIDNRFKKRVFDIVFSSFIIVFFLSWLFPILAALIKLESRGPVLFKQRRSGRNNEIFQCYKFRSMRVNTDSDNKQAGRTDDRITALGRFLRKSSLDELPQFFNVLMGNMSVVGPRPHMLKHTEQYRAIIDRYMVRHFLKPGITGWAQVNGFRGETSNIFQMEKRVEYDIWYLENWSTMLDVKIIFLTIINILKGDRNAY